MKKLIVAAAMVLMAAPVLANDQVVSSDDGPPTTLAPMTPTDGDVPMTLEEAMKADAADIETQQYYGGWRRGWACGWRGNRGAYYGIGWNPYDAYWNGYRSCGRYGRCSHYGCFRHGWWGWSGRNWRYWRY